MTKKELLERVDELEEELRNIQARIGEILELEEDEDLEEDEESE